MYSTIINQNQQKLKKLGRLDITDRFFYIILGNVDEVYKTSWNLFLEVAWSKEGAHNLIKEYYLKLFMQA